MDGYQLKKILEDIIDVAYPKATEREKRRYKGFYIKPMPKRYKSKLGDYDPRTRTIRLYWRAWTTRRQREKSSAKSSLMSLQKRLSILKEEPWQTLWKHRSTSWHII